MNEEFNEVMNEASGTIEVPLTAEDINAFRIYADMLVEKNKVMNLTAITDDKGIAMLHFIDSLTLVPYIRAEQQRSGKADIRITDVGTGAGFPGIPLKILNPDIDLTLMDSLAKRLKFLDEVCGALDLTRTATVHGRAEDLGRNSRYREKFDVATARAVASLPVLCEYCLPLVAPGGAFIAMKGHSEEEIKASAHAVIELGGTIEKVDQFDLAGTDNRRSVIVIRKVRPTPAKYPRKAGVPSKSPL
ncbi:MAG: 16S rRNA (guanine(527)-N(7))-methyltransferase RsmG [Clostridiales bacterium]|nr:16S rRNA (guanine(527)-N(7))-methyltransferase RsmG [Clostridiales bacterium]